MTTYTLFSQATPGGTVNSGAGNNGTTGIHFTVSSTCTLDGIWHYSSASDTQLPTTIAVYTTQSSPTSGTLVTSNTPSWSGAAGSGWVFAAFTSPPTLSSGTDYMAAAFRNDTTNRWFSFYTVTWPVTSGILTAPSETGVSSTSQGWYNSPGTSLAMPLTQSGTAGSNMGMDVQVSVVSAATVAMSFTPPLSVSTTVANPITSTAAMSFNPAMAGTVTTPIPVTTTVTANFNPRIAATASIIETASVGISFRPPISASGTVQGIGVLGLTSTVTAQALLGSVQIKLAVPASYNLVEANTGGVDLSTNGILTNIVIAPYTGLLKTDIVVPTATVAVSALPPEANLTINGMPSAVHSAATIGHLSTTVKGLTAQVAVSALMGTAQENISAPTSRVTVKHSGGISVGISIAGLTANVNTSAHLGTWQETIHGKIANVSVAAPTGSIAKAITVRGLTSKVLIKAPTGAVVQINHITKLQSTQWNTRSSVLTSKNSFWNTRSQVSKNILTRFNTRSNVANLQLTYWKTLAAVNKLVLTHWVTGLDPDGPVIVTIGTQWNTLKAVSILKSTLWNLQGNLGVDWTTKWDTLQVVTKLENTQWNIGIWTNSHIRQLAQERIDFVY